MNSRHIIYREIYEIQLAKSIGDFWRINILNDVINVRKTNEISDICHKSQEPIFVTKNGYGALVLMSIEAYESLITDTQIDAAIAEAETEMEGGGHPYGCQGGIERIEEKVCKINIQSRCFSVPCGI